MNQVNSILAWATLVHVVCKCDECAGTTKYNVVYEHHKITTNCHCDILLQAWNARHNTGMVHNSKIKINHESMCIMHHIITITKTHLIKLTKINPNHIRTTYISSLNNNSTIQEIKAINMKYLEKNRKLIPFLRDWSRNDEQKWWTFESNTVSLRERWTNKTMNSKKCSREN